MEKNTPTRQILANLAYRYRFARQLTKEWKPTQSYVTGYMAGLEEEAWNSYQSAKRIYLNAENQLSNQTNLTQEATRHA